MLDLQQIKKMLHDRNIEVVREATGLSRPVLDGLKHGTLTNPRLKTVQTVSDYLEGKLESK